MKFKVISPVALTALLAGCADTATIQRVSVPRAGFVAVTESSLKAQTGTPVWHLTPAEIAAAETRTKALIHGKTISADTAVQVAMLNNRGLQATYAGLGLSAANVWEAAIGPVPTLGVSVSGLVGDVSRSLEATLLTAVLDTANAKPRSKIAELHFEQAQLAAARETIALAVNTRRAWIEAVAAFETVALISRTQNVANAGSELATELGRTGAMNAADQARQFAFSAEIAADLADARLEAQLAKGRLARLLGVSLGEVSFFVPDALPELPRKPRSRTDIERMTLESRLDLASGLLELEVIAAEYRLTGQTRAVSDAAILAGVEAERENGRVETRPTLDIEFQIPLYDTTELASRKGALEYLQAANLLAEAVVGARSEARAAHLAITGKHSVALHWRDTVLPLRRTIDEETLKSYNGMITSTFELLDDARDGLEAELRTAEAKRNYWLAETDVTAAIWGATSRNDTAAGGDE